MKVYNLIFFLRLMSFPVVVIMVIGMPYLVFYSFQNNPFYAIIYFFLGMIIWAKIFSCLRHMFCSFTIDERGITSKLFIWDIIITWDEFKYIGVGELYNLGHYEFLMYFSKVPLKRIYFSTSSTIRQTGNHFFLVYREGMLEEVLKYVGKDRIRHIERIYRSQYPYENQDGSTSMLRQRNTKGW